VFLSVFSVFVDSDWSVCVCNQDTVRQCQLVQELAGVKGPGCCHVWEADVGYTQPYWNNVKRFQGWKGSQAAPGPWKSPGYHWLVAALCVHLTMHIQHFSESC